MDDTEPPSPTIKLQRSNLQPSALFRVLLWALCAPFVPLLLWFTHFTYSPEILALLLIAFLVLPSFWILWPDFQRGGLRAVSSGRFLATSALATCAAFLTTLLYMVFFVVGYSIWERLRQGT